MYPLKIVACVVMGNHIHILAVVIEPADVPRFKEYTKRELSHAVNRLLGRRNRTVWIDGCDDPVIMDAEKAIERIVYLYTNPQKANLVESIEEYPNFTTWESFLAGGCVEVFPRIARPSIEVLLPSRSLREHYEIAERLLAEAEEEYELQIEPDAWISCFPELEGVSPEELRDMIISKVREQEKLYGESRTTPVIGAHALKLQDIRKPYTSKKFGKRMLCLSSFRSLRAAYIAWRLELHEQARKCYDQWREGDSSVVMPPGMFWPGGWLNAPCDVSIGEFYSFC